VLPAGVAEARDLITYCPQSFSGDLHHYLNPKFLFSSILVEKAYAGVGDIYTVGKQLIKNG
jgi:hypothetical protein